MSKFIFVLKSGIKCHFGGFLISPCPLTPQLHNARIGFLVTVEIGDMQAYAKPFVRNSGIKLHWAL